ncbi:hypothetical protein [Labrys neptuniae]
MTSDDYLASLKFFVNPAKEFRAMCKSEFSIHKQERSEKRYRSATG